MQNVFWIENILVPREEPRQLADRLRIPATLREKLSLDTLELPPKPRPVVPPAPPPFVKEQQGTKKEPKL